MRKTLRGHRLDQWEQPLTVRELEQVFGFKQPWFVRFHWLSFVLILISLIAVAMLIGWWLYATGAAESAFFLIPLAAAITAAWLTYTQWRAARRETSLERFYDRLKSTNDQLANWPHAIAMQWNFELNEHRCLKKEDEELWQQEMYVFTELDNLEYAVEKYWIGFMSRESATRAAHTFLVRCRVPGFRTSAMKIVKSRKDNKIRDYTERTLGTAEKICAEAGKMGPLT